MQDASNIKKENQAQWVPGSVSQINVQSLTKTMTELAGIGALHPTKNDEHFIREAAELPEIEDYEIEDSETQQIDARREEARAGGGSSTKRPG
jgi:hypothetical protein